MKYASAAVTCANPACVLHHPDEIPERTLERQVIFDEVAGPRRYLVDVWSDGRYTLSMKANSHGIWGLPIEGKVV